MSFITEKETLVSELDSVVRLYHHEPTGARFLFLINKDGNKVFGIFISYADIAEQWRCPYH